MRERGDRERGLRESRDNERAELEIELTESDQRIGYRSGLSTSSHHSLPNIQSIGALLHPVSKLTVMKQQVANQTPRH